MIAKIFSGRGLAAALIGGGLVLGSATMALAAKSSSGLGDTRTDALSDAYRSAERLCRIGGNKSPSYSSKDCSKTSYGGYKCVVTYRCR
ncbi:MAG TPA: hypothetical protein VFI93_04735 [Rhizomicrobium sp.]|nr:hypothetical protein [Rhizomicrobium sp.]